MSAFAYSTRANSVEMAGGGDGVPGGAVWADARSAVHTSADAARSSLFMRDVVTRNAKLRWRENAKLILFGGVRAFRVDRPPQGRPEPAACGPARFEDERAAVRFRDPLRDRQSQPRAVAGARFVEPHEPIEDPRPIRFRNAGTAVRDANLHPAVLRCEADRD